MKGEKFCKNGHKNGCRAYFCKICNEPFYINLTKTGLEKKRDKNKYEKCVWTELQYGDIIKVKSGPYFLGENGKIDMGESGKFVVRRFKKDYIVAEPLNQTGTIFIYMGGEKFNEDTGIYSRPHKIRRINVEKRDD